MKGITVKIDLEEGEEFLNRSHTLERRSLMEERALLDSEEGLTINVHCLERRDSRRNRVDC